MSSDRVRPGLATVLAISVCLLLLGGTLFGVMSYRDPMATKAENYIHLLVQLRSSAPESLRP